MSWDGASDVPRLGRVAGDAAALPVAGFEEQQLVRATDVADRDGVAAGEAGGAEAVAFARLEEAVHAALAEEAKGVGADELADAFDRMRRGDQLLSGRRVDAVEARADGRRRADPHVHLARPGMPDHVGVRLYQLRPSL